MLKTLQSTLLEIVFFWFHFRKFTEYDKLITLTVPENKMNRKHPKLATLNLEKSSKIISVVDVELVDAEPHYPDECSTGCVL